MAFITSDVCHLAEPGVRQMFDEETPYEKVVEVVAKAIFDHKRWRKPARKLVNQVIWQMARELSSLRE